MGGNGLIIQFAPTMSVGPLGHAALSVGSRPLCQVTPT